MLAADIDLAPHEVIEFSAKRWRIEPMFNQAKNNLGWNKTRQQSRQAVHRRLYILGIGYAPANRSKSPNHLQQPGNGKRLLRCNLKKTMGRC